MIEGIHVDVDSKELNNLILERAAVHKGKALAYNKQVKDLEASGIGEDANLSGDPVSGLKGKVKDHERKAAYFQFLADHIVPNETYRLSMSDLSNIELLSRWF
jgi:hypothetical protein